MNKKFQRLYSYLILSFMCVTSLGAVVMNNPAQATYKELETIEFVKKEIDIPTLDLEYVMNNSKADEVIFEPIVAEAAVEPVVTETVMATKEESYLTQDEIDLIALVTMAEAEGEPEEGKRLVIDVILNRMDSERHPNTAYDVIYQPHQFSAMWNSRVDRCYVREDIVQLVKEELQNRTNYDVIYFRTDYFSKYGTPLFQVGNHYFSSY